MSRFVAAFAVGAALSLLVALPAWRKGSLSGSGAIAAVALGTFVYVGGGWRFFAILMAFFLSSSILGKILPRFGDRVRSTLEQVDRVIVKGGRRDHTQVFASGFTALGFAIAYAVRPEGYFYAAFAASLAASTADTWASEIGPLSARPPRLILSGKRVERGISGGVSPLGFGASAAGALFLAAVSLLLKPKGIYEGAASVILALAVWAGGFLGSVVDSVIGELWQAKYDDGGGLTERPSGPSGARRLVRGLRFMDNNAVNLISALLASQGCWLLLFALR